MKNLTTDTHAHDPATDQELFELLSKEAAQTPGESPGDDNKSTVGGNPDQYPDPEDSGAGSIDARWGDKDDSGDGQGPNDAVHHSTEVIKKFREGREDMLDKLFDGKASSDGAEQKLMGSHLKHVASGDFQSRAPQLKPKSSIQKTSSVPQTLMERVRETYGRH